MKDAIIEAKLHRHMPGSCPLLNDKEKLMCTIAFSIGYDDGFQTAQAAERGIEQLQRKIDDLERELESTPAPTSDLANTSRPGADSQLSDPFDMICSTLASIPGSGYEFLKR